jgi:hypothetical protein
MANLLLISPDLLLQIFDRKNHNFDLICQTNRKLNTLMRRQAREYMQLVHYAEYQSDKDDVLHHMNCINNYIANVDWCWVFTTRIL